jgi:hypothetical protein
MKMRATFSEAFLQAELDYRRERLTGVVARQPRVHRFPARRPWRRGSAPAPVSPQPTPAQTAPVCRPIHAGTLH